MKNSNLQSAIKCFSRVRPFLLVLLYCGKLNLVFPQPEKIHRRNPKLESMRVWRSKVDWENTNRENTTNDGTQICDEVRKGLWVFGYQDLQKTSNQGVIIKRQLHWDICERYFLCVKEDWTCMGESSKWNFATGK